MKTSPSSPPPLAARLIYLVFLLLAVGSAYAFLHEGGHALAGLAAGGRITAFNAAFINLGAHVSMEVDFTPAQAALNNAAGALLPLLAWLLLVLALPPRLSMPWEAARLTVSMGVVNTLLVWIVIPMMALSGNAPPGDDVTRFLENSGWPPLALSALALALYAGAWLLLWRRTRPLQELLARLRDPRLPWFPAEREPLLRILFGAGAALLLAFQMEAVDPASPLNPGNTPPPGHSRVAHISLEGRTYEGEEIARFRLEQPAPVSLALMVRQIDTPLVDVALEGPDGFRTVLLHGEGYSAVLDRPSMKWETLPAGEYRLLLTSRPSPGEIEAWLRTGS